MLRFFAKSDKPLQFSRKKFISWCKRNHLPWDEAEWPVWCDGQPATNWQVQTAHGYFWVKPEWCSR